MLVRHVLVLLLFALGFALVACGSPTPSPVLPTTTATAQVATPQPPTPSRPAISQLTASPQTPTRGLTPTPGPKDLMLGGLSSALAKIKTYRALVPEEGRFMEVVLPDRVRQANNGIKDTTKIGGLLYQFDFNDNVFVRPISSVPFIDRVNLVWFQDQVSKSSGFAALGASTIDGTPTIGYSTNFTISSLTPPTTPGATPVVTQIAQPVKLWLAVTDGLPRRIEYGPPVSVTVNFFDFNASIEINPPQ
jgi:hypothetical protein